jgi:hypothetical protein
VYIHVFCFLAWSLVLHDVGSCRKSAHSSFTRADVERDVADMHKSLLGLLYIETFEH